MLTENALSDFYVESVVSVIFDVKISFKTKMREIIKCAPTLALQNRLNGLHFARNLWNG